jgi:nucleotide-binding universal stress UspA family protein
MDGYQLKGDNLMIKKVLVSIDGTMTAELALDYAIHFSSKLGVELTVACMTGLGCSTYFGDLTSHIAKKMEQYNAEIKVDEIAIEGEPIKGLASCGNRRDIDLIIMTAKSTSETNRKTIADIGMTILSKTQRPAILIRPDKQYGQSGDMIKRILVPLDESAEGELVIKYVGQIASAFEADVVLFEVIPFTEREPVVALSSYLNYEERGMEDKKVLSLHYLNTVAAHMRQYHKNLKVTCATRVGSAGVEITDYAGEVNADLIVMSTRGHTGLKRWAFGSTANEVILQSNKNLLLIKQH